MKINYFKIYKEIIFDIELEIARLYYNCLELERNNNEMTLFANIKKIEYLIKLLEKHRNFKNKKIVNNILKISDIYDLLNKYN